MTASEVVVIMRPCEDHEQPGTTTYTSKNVDTNEDCNPTNDGDVAIVSIEPLSDPVDVHNCDELKRFSGGTVIQINKLKEKQNEVKEWGFDVYNDRANYPYGFDNANDIRNGGGILYRPNRNEPNYKQKSIGSVHMHTNAGVPMFSGTDIIGFIAQYHLVKLKNTYSSVNSNHNAEVDAFAGLKIPDRTYMLRVNDVAALDNFLSVYRSYEYRERIKKAVQDAETAEGQSLHPVNGTLQSGATPSGYMRRFLTVLQSEFGNAIALYEKKDGLDEKNRPHSWSKITLDPDNNNLIKKTPCPSI